MSADRFADGVDDGSVRGDAEDALIGDFAVVYPDGEFALFSRHEVGVDAEIFLDGGRRTEGPWSISSSDRAEADAYFAHNNLVTFLPLRRQKA